MLIAVGGVLFTVGSVFLFTNWPDPFPRVFGYHEVWHLLVVAAVVCHFVAIASVVHAPSPPDPDLWTLAPPCGRQRPGQNMVSA